MESLTLTVEETARLLGISRNTAYGLVAQGVIPSLRLGRRLVVPRKGLDALLNSTAHVKGPSGGQGP